MGTARIKPGPKPRPPEERFWSKVDKHGPLPDARPELGRCWLWMASQMIGGYGQFDRGRYAHRVAYELLIGAIPEGLDLDHLCRVRNCVNPAHLEPVTRQENLLRGDTIPAAEAARTHCPQGHPYDEDNTYVWRGKRRCKTCNRDVQRARYHRRKAA